MAGPFSARTMFTSDVRLGTLAGVEIVLDMPRTLTLGPQCVPMTIAAAEDFATQILEACREAKAAGGGW